MEDQPWRKYLVVPHAFIKTELKSRNHKEMLLLKASGMFTTTSSKISYIEKSMRLEIGNILISDIQFADATKVENSVLTFLGKK